MMANQIQPHQHPSPDLEARRHTGAFVLLSMVIALLFVSDLYLFERLNAGGRALEALQHYIAIQIRDVGAKNDQWGAKFATVEERHEVQINALQRELEVAARSLGKNNGQVLDHARVMVAQLQRDQRQDVGRLQQEMSEKAEGAALVGIDKEVQAAAAGLQSTQRSVDVLAKDLGVARSEFGTRIASNQEDTTALHQVTDRENHQFVLPKDGRLYIEGIGLILKKVDVKHQRFSLELIVNDRSVRNDNQNAGQPIIFYVGGAKVPCEIVTTEVDNAGVQGYLSIPRSEVPRPQPHSAEGSNHGPEPE
jgi:hypothetical protein